MVQSIVEAVEHFAQQTPDSLCIADENFVYTYGSSGIPVGEKWHFPQ